MSILQPRTVASFVLGAVVATAAATAGAAFAGGDRQPARTPVRAAAPTVLTTITACVRRSTGAMVLVGNGSKRTACRKGEVEVAWLTGPAGVARDGSLRLQSPDGRFGLVLSNDGVGITGPGGAFYVDALESARLNAQRQKVTP